jgi:hypothetical protein
MERHRSRSTDPPHGSAERWSDRNRDECRPIKSVDAWPAATGIPGPSARPVGDVQTSGRDSVDPGCFFPSDSLRDQLQAIRRRLWILNATLESLPAKIELAYRLRSQVASRDGQGQPRNTSDGSGDKRLTFTAKGAHGGWLARWKLARLRSRADRAERRAVAAIHDASAAFGAALNAVLHAAIARVKADDACRDPSCDRPSRHVAENAGVS